jgi:hypothetical protein
MCRAANKCTELGSNPALWPRNSPLAPRDWFEEQLDIFHEAVSQFVDGDSTACLTTLAKTRSNEMRDWYIEHGQMSGKHRARALGVSNPAEIAIDQRDPERSPKKLEDQVFLRDGFHCRYCGLRLVSGKILKALIQALDTSEFRRGPRNVDTHGILCIFYPSADHMIPWNLGGRTDLDNLVTSCVPCNFGKDRFTIEQLGIESPLLRAPKVDHWDGLLSLLEGIKDARRLKMRTG